MQFNVTPLTQGLAGRTYELDAKHNDPFFGGDSFDCNRSNRAPPESHF
jgi:hypothetical protein